MRTILIITVLSLAAHAQTPSPTPTPPVPDDHLEKMQDCAKLKAPVKPTQCSNGCGPEWLLKKDVMPEFSLLLNNQIYTGRHNKTKTEVTFKVDFTPACALHDTGYAGLNVIDEFGEGKNPTVDFRKWSRGEVDKKFYRDLVKICERTIHDSKEALEKCKDDAEVYQTAVEKLGFWSFDCNLDIFGLQTDPPCTRKTYLFWNT